MTTRRVEKWIESTVCGFAEFSRCEWVRAATLWIEADAALSGEKPAFAPLHAASRTNAGSANLILGQRAAAERAFDQANFAWREIIAQVDDLDVPMTGLSSSYHFRLATVARDALIEARRQRYRRLALGALAITHFNRDVLDAGTVGTDLVPRSRTALRATISENLGYASPEARLLAALEVRHNRESFREIYADKLADIGSPALLAYVLSEDCRKLEHSVTLTALLAIPISPPVVRDRPTSRSFENNCTCDELELE